MVEEYLPDTVVEHRIEWVVIFGLTASLVVLLTWLTPKLRESRTRGGLFLVPDRQPGWVRRTELDEVVSTLTMRGSGTVGLTTGLAGAGGFGKTSLAVEACHSDEVRKRFGGGVIWVTVGRDRAGADIAALANDVTEAVLGVRPEFSSPEQAGHRMAEALAERGRVLLVVDDVWSLRQLRPFLAAAARSRVLVTTRLPRALPPKAIAMIVDEMAPRVAVQVLSRGLPPMNPGVVSDLVGLTGRWPLLLFLVNARLRDEHGAGTNADVAARRAAERLGRTVPAVLDVTVASQRETAVLATVEHSLEALGAFDRARFLELGVFPEDAEIPVTVVELLWRGTAGLTSKQAERLCGRLQDLSLVSRRHARGTTPSITIHDVVRSAVRSEGGLGKEHVEAANRDLLDEARNLIPDDDLTADAEWWRLPQTVPYLWDHLLFHLSEARRYRELESLLHDVRWFVARVRAFGVAAAEADLALSTSRSVAGVRRLIDRSAHLLTPFESDAVSTANLLARLYAFPPMRASVERYSQENKTTFLRARWPLPDDGATCLLRTLTSATRRLNQVSITPDGSRFVVHARDGGAQIWKVDGTTRTTLATHGRPVHEVVVAPDGSWLVTRSGSRRVQIWGIGGAERAVLRTGVGKLAAMVAASDGSWLATLSASGKGRLWNPDGSRRATLRSGTGKLAGLVAAPDGSWLATRSARGGVALWSPGGKRRLVLRSRVRVRTKPRRLKDVLRMRGWSQEDEKVSGRNRPIGKVSEIAVSPDGSWLATLSGDGSVRLWGVDGVERAVLTGHTGAGSGMRISPDGSWLATWASTGPVRLWEADGRQRAVLTGHAGAVRQVVIAPDGSWLAACSDEGTIRIWQSERTARQSRRGRTGTVRQVTISPEGSWIATHSGDGSVKLWNEDRIEGATLTVPLENSHHGAVSPDKTWLAVWSADHVVRIRGAGGRRRAIPTGHAGRLRGVVIAPDSTWLATWSADRTVRLWGAGGSRRAVLAGHTGPVREVVIAPDSTWLATCSEDGTARVWWADGTERAVLVANVRATAHLLISPDGGWLATLSIYGKIQLWKPDGRRYATLRNRVEDIGEITVAPNGRWFAIFSANGTAGLWGADGKARASLKGCPGPARGVTIAPDGTWLAACFDDGGARVWSAGGTERARLSGGEGRIRGVAISPDSNLLATCSDDGTIRVWDRYGESSAAGARVEAGLNCLAWFPSGFALAAGGDQGLYGFDLYPPPE